MKHHKITSLEDIIELQKWYEDDSIFEVLETGIEVTFPELIEDLGAYLSYFSKGFTIQHI